MAFGLDTITARIGGIVEGTSYGGRRVVSGIVARRMPMEVGEEGFPLQQTASTYELRWGTSAPLFPRNPRAGQVVERLTAEIRIGYLLGVQDGTASPSTTVADSHVRAAVSLAYADFVTIREALEDPLNLASGMVSVQCGEFGYAVADAGDGAVLIGRTSLVVVVSYDPTTVVLSGTVRNFDTGLPVSGVTVAVVGDSGTVATDADGAWTLTTRGGRDATVRYTEATLRPTQTTLALGAADVSGIVAYAIPATLYASILAAVSLSEVTADGAVFAFYSPPETAPAGFGLTLTPSSGAWIAPDPPTLSAATLADVGALFVANVTPGTKTASATAPSGHSVARASYVAASQAVSAGVMTFLHCDWV